MSRDPSPAQPLHDPLPAPATAATPATTTPRPCLLPPPPACLPLDFIPQVVPAGASSLPVHLGARSRSPIRSPQPHGQSLSDAPVEMVPETPPELQGAQPRVASIIVVPSPRVHGASSSSCSGSPADAGRDADASGEGWQLVCSRRGPRPPPPPAPASTRRPLPAWMHGRCCRCLAPGHRASVCRDPFRCSRCLQPGHRARGCTNAWRPLSSLKILRRPATAPPVAAPAPRPPTRGWPAPPHAEMPTSSAWPQLGGAALRREGLAATDVLHQAPHNSGHAATVWLAGAQSDASCKAVAEVLASAIGANIVEIRVIRQFVDNAAVDRQVENARAASPSKRMPASTVLEDVPTTCDALRICSPTRTMLPSPSSSASRPPGFEASPVMSSAPQTPPFITDACRTPCSAATDDVCSPATETVAVSTTPPQTPTPAPTLQLTPMRQVMVHEEQEPPAGFDTLFQPCQEAILGAPPTLQGKQPGRRRKTMAGMSIDQEGPAFSLRRSSARLWASGRARIVPVQKEAQKMVCRSLGIVKDGQDVTAAALAELEEQFKEEIPGTVLAALHALFKLDDAQAMAVEDAIIAQGGANVLDHEEEVAATAA